jgi:hypothetical protein
VDNEILDFIKAAVGSVWALELLQFVRAHPERGWSVAELARELRSNERLATDALQTFETAGLLARGPEGFAYAPASPRLDDLAGRLIQAYRERPVAVVNAIVSSRTDSLQSFADAFRFKGGPGK